MMVASCLSCHVRYVWYGSCEYGLHCARTDCIVKCANIESVRFGDRARWSE